MHIDYAVKPNCYNLTDSYGEICVGCNCCGRFDKKRIYESRLNVDKKWLKYYAEQLTDENWADRWTDKQIEIILKDCEYRIRAIRKSMKKIGERNERNKV